MKPILRMTILKECADHYGLEVDDVQDGRRPVPYVRAREAYTLLCRLLTCYSFPMIAETFNSHHSTSMSAYTRGVKRFHNDPDFRSSVFAIADRLVWQSASPDAYGTMYRERLAEMMGTNTLVTTGQEDKQ